MTPWNRALLALVAILLPMAATAAPDTVNRLAQGCYAIKSPATGEYLAKQGTAAGSTFRFTQTGLDAATPFYIKPAAPGQFLLTDAQGHYLSSVLPTIEFSGTRPSLASEWEIGTSGSGSTAHFSLTNRQTGTPISHSYWKTETWFWGWFKTTTLKTESAFILAAHRSCRPYPEMQVNVAGDRSALRQPVTAPVRGFVDSHTHITSYEFMGGTVMHGDPFHRWGVAHALPDSKVIHGENGSLDLIGNLYQHGDPGYRYDTRGWPDFPWWPNHAQLTHSGYYYKWIERAWLGGLRIMVTNLVENEVLCNVQSTINPVAWTGHNSCNTMDSLKLQAHRLYQMQAYIDAQSGGPGKGFFRIVTSPQQARAVIADGKLAVVMGVEASETFNCGERDYCSVAKLEAGLEELYNLGVRSIFPAHKFDNQLSGSHAEDGFINIGQALSTGHFFHTKECDADTRGRKFSAGFPLIRDIPVVSDLLAQTGVGPDYDGSIEHCNTRGLTPLGIYLVNRMIDRKMIIEMDHASTDSVSAMLDIVEARQYSGVVTSHSWMHRNKQGGLHRNTLRMIQSGGFVAPYNSDANSMRARVGDYLDALEASGFHPGVGLGTDMAGLGGQAGPRADAASQPLAYPFVSEFGLRFDRQVAGHRTFDLNRDGVAHYGMVADHVQDIRERSGARIYNAVMRSAEAYLQMWERSTANLDAQYVTPDI